jgi:PEGA domain
MMMASGTNPDYIDLSAAVPSEVSMTRMLRLAVLLGVFVLVGLAFPSAADAQRRGGGGGGAVARGGAIVHGGGAVVRGGGAVYGAGHVAVPRTYRPYSYYRPYYYRPYYYGPRYYYPYYSSPWSFSLSFGFGWYGGYSAPYYAYPYYPYPYPYAYPPYPYPYPYSYPPPNPSQSPSQYPSQPQYPSPTSNNGRNNMASTSAPRYQPAQTSTASRGDGRGEFGTLSIRVMPSDATILIDHQAWDRTRGDDHFSIELVGGPHQVEVRKAGFTSYVRTIEVPRGRSLAVNVALSPGGTGTTQVARAVPVR